MYLLIADSVLANNLTLVTKNEKHFKIIEELKLANWIRDPE